MKLIITMKYAIIKKMTLIIRHNELRVTNYKTNIRRFIREQRPLLLEVCKHDDVKTVLSVVINVWYGSMSARQ